MEFGGNPTSSWRVGAYQLGRGAIQRLWVGGGGVIKLMKMNMKKTWRVKVNILYVKEVFTHFIY